MNEYKHDQMPDPEKIKEIIDIVSEKVPSLIRDFSDLLYSPQSATRYAEAAATFYKKLKEAGMNDKESFDLTSQYLSTLNIGKMANNLGHG